MVNRPTKPTDTISTPHLGLPVHLNGRPTTTYGGGVQRMQQQWRTAATSLERRREMVRKSGNREAHQRNPT
ncbi:hypothetical protein Hanom_Chr08g00725711 [Helianthus anomalus]